MKTTIIVFLLSLLVVQSFAQSPTIDSIAVDENKGELVLHGAFPNSASAIVRVDSVSLPVTLASDTLIRATIPDTGKGSCGITIISLNGITSNPKTLTYVHFEDYNLWQHYYSDGGFETEYNDYRIHIRADFIGFGHNSVHVLIPSRISKYRIVASGGNGFHGANSYKYSGATYDSTVVFSKTLDFDSKNRQFQFEAWQPNAYDATQIYFNSIVSLDSNYEVMKYFNASFGNPPSCASESFGQCTDIKSLSPTEFPPSSSAVHDPASTPIILGVNITSDPISENAGITLILQYAMPVRIEILDILGHLRYSDQRRLSPGENKIPINSSSLPAGVYICRLQAGSDVKSMRFIKE